MKRKRDWVSMIATYAVIGIVVIIAIAVVIVLVNDSTDRQKPGYCNQTCRIVKYRQSLVDECMKNESFTRDQCVKLFAGG